MSDNLDKRDMQELFNAFELANSIVLKDYVRLLDGLDIEEPSKEFLEQSLSKEIRMFKVNKIVYDKNENNIEKLTNFYNMVEGLEANTFIFINSDGNKVDFYMGVCNEDKDSALKFKIESLYNGLLGNFPGSLSSLEIDIIEDTKAEEILELAFDEQIKSVSSFSGVAAIRGKNNDKNENFIQGIEKMLETMRGSAFSTIILANPINSTILEKMKWEFEELYTSLNPFLKTQVSFNESHANGVMNSLSQSMADTYGSSKSTSLSLGVSESFSKTKGGSIGINAGINSSRSGSISGSIGIKFVGAAASVAKSIGQSLGISASRFSSKTKTEGTSKTDTETDTTTESKTVSDTQTVGENVTDTSGSSLQLEYEDKKVKQLLEKIDVQLERIKYCESFGVFSVAAYFLGKDKSITNMAASNYKSLVSGDNTFVEVSHINTWDKSEDVSNIKEYIKRFYHPVFKLYSGDNLNYVTPATLVSGQELAIHMGLPTKSLPGITVTECAKFGRNIFKLSNNERESKIEIGNIYHMNSVEKARVELNIKDLSMHTFITGSTGSGKSNTIYTLLKKLDDNDITFLVVEPAKGEYKHVFGNRKDVTVLGTNPNISNMLKLNPFYFPKEIHVLEHIDKLIEIFNVCWPMYAAMPAVLKDSIERAYISSGWDLNESINYNSDIVFPTFKDVLKQLYVVINESEFSEEVKSNYIGALVTRVKSLTNGINGQIFVYNQIDNNILFDTNVIVDLSRVSSAETKSMIMGILVMKLQEYRMSQGGMNESLKHVTILEEAHNLLKKTSSSQSVEGGSLVAKSVEMLSNIIAEVRTYGEGFIIADQAPGLLDESVIRNTNTKIILRLPDYQDRQLVGKSANLNEDQIIEIAKLPVGVAAIYHNDWIEPVLCKLDKFEGKGNAFEYNRADIQKVNYKVEIINILKSYLNGKDKIDSDIDNVRNIIINSDIETSLKLKLIRIIESDSNIEDKEFSSIVYKIFNSEFAFKNAKEAKNMEEWNRLLILNLDSELKNVSNELQNIIIKSILQEKAKEDDYFEDMKIKWINYMSRRQLL